MSCFVMDVKPLSAIADFIAYLLSYNYSFKGMEAPTEIAHALYEDCYDRTFMEWKPEKIYEKLYRLNQAAYNGRYNLHSVSFTIPPYKSENTFTRCEWDGQNFVVQDWHYEIANRIACYNYQCDEDATRSSELHLAMVKLQKTLCEFIVFNNPIFSKHKWGT